MADEFDFSPEELENSISEMEQVDELTHPLIMTTL